MPSGSGGGPQNAPNVFQPPNQGAAAQGFSNLVSPMATQGAGNLGMIDQLGTPFGLTYPFAISSAYNTINNPYQNQAIAGGQNAADFFNAYGAPLGIAGAQGLQSFGNMALGGAVPNAVTSAMMNPNYATANMGGLQAFNTAFDPQNALRSNLQQRTLDNATVANSIAGLGSSPYGASTTANALTNFDLNWENQRLARMGQGIQDILQPANNQIAAAVSGTSGLQNLAGIGQGTFNTGLNLVNNAAAGTNQFNMLPYGTFNTIQGNNMGALTNLNALGSSGYLIPQQAIGDFSTYMQLGTASADAARAAAATNNQIGATNFNQLASGLGGANQLLFGNSLANSGGLLGMSGLTGGAGGLFGGGLPADVAATGGLFDSPAAFAPLMLGS